MRKLLSWFALALLVVAGPACTPDSSSSDDTDDTWVPDTSSPDTAEDDSGPTDTNPPPTDTAPTDSGDPDSGPSDTGPSPDAPPQDTFNGDAYPSMFGSGSFVKKLWIDKQNPGTPRCCFDYDSDSANDNALADMIQSLGPVTVSGVNGTIQQNIQDGSFIYLFEYKNWSTSNWQNDSSITMMAHPGKAVMGSTSDTGVGSPDADAGSGDAGSGDAGSTPRKFRILSSSYDSNGNPKSKFMSASVSSRDLTAQGGKLEITLPLGGGVSTALVVTDPDLEAKVETSASVGAGGTVPLTNGKMGGIIKKKDFYGALNDRCSQCNAGQLISRTSSGSDTWQCQTSGCACNPGLISAFCSNIRSAAANNADVDTNNNGTNDALSFGASFEASGAEIVGVAP